MNSLGEEICFDEGFGFCCLCPSFSQRNNLCVCYPPLSSFMQLRLAAMISLVILRIFLILVVFCKLTSVGCCLLSLVLWIYKTQWLPNVVPGVEASNTWKLVGSADVLAHRGSWVGPSNMCFFRTLQVTLKFESHTVENPLQYKSSRVSK